MPCPDPNTSTSYEPWNPPGTCHRPPATTAAAAADAACGSDSKKSMPIKDHKKKEPKESNNQGNSLSCVDCSEIQAFPVFAPRAFDTRWAPLSLPHQIQGAVSTIRTSVWWRVDLTQRPRTWRSGAAERRSPAITSITKIWDHFFPTTNSTKLSSCPGRERATCKSKFV